MLDPAEVRRRLAVHPPKVDSSADLLPAAVLLPLFRKDGEDHVLFTRRTDHLPHHRGEISFPGGRWQKEDPDLLATALRETEEEMGILRRDVDILGRLDDFISIYGYRVTPFVGHFPYPYPFAVNEREIDEIILAPLSVLVTPDLFRRENWEHRGRMEPVFFYSIGRHEVWGLTAAILRQFLHRAGLVSEDQEMQGPDSPRAN